MDPASSLERVMIPSKTKTKKDQEKERKARVTEMINNLADFIPSNFYKHKTQYEILKGAMDYIQLLRSGNGSDNYQAPTEAQLRSQNLDLTNQVAFLRAQLSKSRSDGPEQRKFASVAPLPARPTVTVPQSPAPHSSSRTKPGMADATTETSEMMQMITIPASDSRQPLALPHSSTVNNYNYVIINNDQSRMRRKHISRYTSQAMNPVAIAPRMAEEAVEAVQCLSDIIPAPGSTHDGSPASQIISAPLSKTLVSVKTQTLESSLPPKAPTPSPPPAPLSSRHSPTPGPMAPPSPGPINIAAPLSPQFVPAAATVAEKAPIPSRPPTAASNMNDCASSYRITDIHIGTPPPQQAPESASRKFSVDYLSNDYAASAKKASPSKLGHFGSYQQGRAKAVGKARGKAGEGNRKPAAANPGYQLTDAASSLSYDYAPQPQPVYGVYTGAAHDETQETVNLGYEAGAVDEMWAGQAYTSSTSGYSDYIPNAATNWAASATSAQPCSQPAAAASIFQHSGGVGVDQYPSAAALYGDVHGHKDKRHAGFSFLLSGRPSASSVAKAQGNFHIANMLPEASVGAAKRKRPFPSPVSSASLSREHLHSLPPKLLPARRVIEQGAPNPYPAHAAQFTPSQAQLYLAQQLDGAGLNAAFMPNFSFSTTHHS